MTVPLDEDAAGLAQVAQSAARALHEATHPSVGYPGLADPGDVAEVLQALAELTGGLQSTLAHLDRFLHEEIEAGRLTGTGGSSGAGELTATRAELQQAHAAARALSTAAEAVRGTTSTRS